MTATSPADEKLVNVEELREILFTERSRPSTNSLREYAEQGLIPFVKLKGRIFFSVSAVREVLTPKAKFIACDKANDDPAVIREAFEHNKAEIKRRDIASEISQHSSEDTSEKS